MNQHFKNFKKENPLAAEQLREELYYNARKNYPGELPFPERFNLKLDTENFQKGLSARQLNNIEIISIGWSPSEDRINDIQENHRLTRLIRNTLPKIFKDQKLDRVLDAWAIDVNNIQFACQKENIRDEWDNPMEYHFMLYPADDKTQRLLKRYNQSQVLFKDLDTILRVRLHYANRIINTAGARFEITGYIYTPRKK